MSRAGLRDSVRVVLLVMPRGAWAVGELHDNSEAVEFWERTYDAIPLRSLRVCRSRVAMASLWRECDAYQRRVFTKNSKAWMKLLASLPFVGLFRPVYIRLTDIQKTVRFSFFDELQEVSDSHEPDIEMSCESLAFMFANEFGFDTLMVNARFNANKRGLDRVMRNFAVGTVNTIGWAVGWSMFALFVREFKLIWLVIHELNNVNPE